VYIGRRTNATHSSISITILFTLHLVIFLFIQIYTFRCKKIIKSLFVDVIINKTLKMLAIKKIAVIK